MARLASSFLSREVQDDHEERVVSGSPREHASSKHSTGFSELVREREDSVRAVAHLLGYSWSLSFTVAEIKSTFARHVYCEDSEQYVIMDALRAAALVL